MPLRVKSCDSDPAIVCAGPSSWTWLPPMAGLLAPCADCVQASGHAPTALQGYDAATHAGVALDTAVRGGACGCALVCRVDRVSELAGRHVVRLVEGMLECRSGAVSGSGADERLSAGFLTGKEARSPREGSPSILGPGGGRRVKAVA